MREGYLSFWIVLRATSGCSISPDGYWLIFLSSFPFVLTSLFFKSSPNHSPDLPAGMPANILAHWQYLTAWRGAKKELMALYQTDEGCWSPRYFVPAIAEFCQYGWALFLLNTVSPLVFLTTWYINRSGVYIAPFETVSSTRPVLRPWFRTGQRFILVNRPFSTNDWL